MLEKISKSCSAKTFPLLAKSLKFHTSPMASPAPGAFRKSILSLLEYLSNFTVPGDIHVYPLFSHFRLETLS